MITPIERRDVTDPGDEVLRRFRYQFAYGVILLINARTGRQDYSAIWCEQYEDYLAETRDGEFDAYQIKTKKPELGEWELNDEELWKSIAKFADLDSEYPDKIRRFKIVSNARYSDTSAVRRLHFSPVKLLAAINRVESHEQLTNSAREGFDKLLEKINVDPKFLFRVLKRLDLIIGPTDRAFEDELAQTHIPSLEECSSLSPSTLARIRDALIAKIAIASSLYTNDPQKHLIALNRDNQNDPLLIAKRITVEDLTLIVREVAGGMFRYLPSLATVPLCGALERIDKINLKMARGGLATYYDMMYRRSLSAEQALLDLATRPDGGTQIISQVENVVLGECDEARLRAAQNPEPYGPKMLIDVQDRLKRIAQYEPERVFNQQYDTLIGMAGILTSVCKVWWSNPFEVEVAE